jgi:hypothetical protein
MNGTNSSAKHYDMVVIGSCAARHHGAIQAANLGKKVVEFGSHRLADRSGRTLRVHHYCRSVPLA